MSSSVCPEGIISVNASVLNANVIEELNVKIFGNKRPDYESCMSSPKATPKGSARWNLQRAYILAA